MSADLARYLVFDAECVGEEVDLAHLHPERLAAT
jgi:hypothetical protein